MSTTIEEVLLAKLITGNPSYGARVYPVQVAQNPTYPCVTYHQVSEVTPHAMGSDPDLRQARWQVSSWGATYGQAKIAADEVSTALSRYRASVSGLEVLDVFKELELDLYDFEARVYHVVVDFLVMHRN